MPEFPWTRLEGTPIWRAASATYQSDPRRRYHAWPHVGRLYHWAAAWQIPYCAHLDRAILAHDVIYDAGPEKEARSALWLQAFTGDPCPEETRLIMATTTHPITPGGDNRIQLLDLADLGVPELVALNRARICTEICALHAITPAQFAAGNKAYFTAMRARYPDALLAQLSPDERARLAAIRAGIDHTIALADQQMQAHNQSATPTSPATP